MTVKGHTSENTHIIAEKMTEDRKTLGKKWLTDRFTFITAES